MVLLEYVRLVTISVLTTSSMVLSSDQTDRADVITKLNNFLEQFDIDLGKENHPFKEKLHPEYCKNLKNEQTGEILLLHDHKGNIQNSTFHYLAMKVHEIYETPNSFISEKAVRKSMDGLPEEAIMYLAHRNLMRHALGYFGLEFYMTLLYRSRQEALERISNHYTGKRRRDIVEQQIAKNNFDEQFSALLARLRVLMTQQMLYTEKCYYWNRNCNEDDDNMSSVSKEIHLLGVIHEQQRALCENLPEFYKLIKTKRKFFIQHEMKDQIAEDNENKKMVELLKKRATDISFYDSQAQSDDKK